MVLRSIAVTGVSGVLGRALLSSAKKESIGVRAFSRTLPTAPAPSISWTEWNLVEERSVDQVADLIGTPDAIIHAGAAVPAPGERENRMQIFDANLRASFTIAEYALRAGIPMVFISGATVYERPNETRIHEDDPKTGHGDFGFYGYSKHLAETAMSYLVHEGLQLVTLRPSSIYGPGMHPSRRLPRLIAHAQQDEELRISPPFEDRVDLVFAADVADACFLALRKGAWGTFNIGSGCAPTMLEVAETVVRAVGKGRVVTEGGTTASRPTLRFDLDFGKASKTFGYEPRYPFEDGLREMLKEGIHE